MLREKNRLLLRFHRLIDLSITAGCFIAAYFIKKHILPFEYSSLSTGPNYYLVLVLIVMIWPMCFTWVGLYQSFREKPFKWFFINIIKACLFGILILNVVLFAMGVKDMSRILMGIFFVLNIFGLTLFKWCVLMMLQQLRAQGYNTRNVLIVGSRDRAVSVIKSIDVSREGGYRILGCFDINLEIVGSSVVNGYKVIGTITDLKAYLENNVVDELIFAMPLRLIENPDKYLVLAESMGVRVRFIPDWQIHYLKYTPAVAQIHIIDFSGIPTLTLQSTPVNEGQLLMKSLMDYGLALFFLIVLSPVFAIISLAIYSASPGPVFYSQERLGQNGRRFKVLKFRSMVLDADKKLAALTTLNEADGPAFKIKKDPRIIPYVGTFLRKTSLDELPQFINVLMGDMSLVGPRPPLPSEVCQYEVWQRRRLSMKPGLTCLWQIAPKRNDLTFDEWMKLDLLYIDKWSLRLDFMLIMKTVGSVLTGAGR